MKNKLRNSLRFTLFTALMLILALSVNSEDTYWHVKIYRADTWVTSHYNMQTGDFLQLDYDYRLPAIFRGSSPLRYHVEPDGTIMYSGRPAGLIFLEDNDDLLQDASQYEFFVYPDRTVLNENVLRHILEKTQRPIYLSLEGFKGNADELEKLNALGDRLFFLSLRNSQIAKIKKNIRLNNLQHLDLSKCSINPTEILKIVGSSRVISLDMEGINLKGSNFDFLSNMQQLRSLIVSHTSFNKNDMITIEKNRYLNDLDISSTEIDDEALENLKSFRYLRRLDVSGNKIGEEGLKFITHVSWLRELNINGITSVVIRDMFDNFENMRHLQLLNMRNNRLRTKDLRDLADCPILRRLDLSNCELTDRDIKYLRGLINLHELFISGNRLEGDGIKYLDALDMLKILDLSDNAITGDQQQYFKYLESLHALLLKNNPIDNRGVSFLRGFRSLTYLDLEGTTVTEDSSDFIFQIPLLREIILKGTGYQESDIEELARRKPGLEVKY